MCSWNKQIEMYSGNNKNKQRTVFENRKQTRVLVFTSTTTDVFGNQCRTRPGSLWMLNDIFVEKYVVRLFSFFSKSQI